MYIWTDTMVKQQEQYMSLQNNLYWDQFAEYQ